MRMREAVKVEKSPSRIAVLRVKCSREGSVRGRQSEQMTPRTRPDANSNGGVESRRGAMCVRGWTASKTSLDSKSGRHATV